MKKGFSLVEIVVAMGIFIVVMTLAVGAFVTVSRMKGLTSTMKESQQKVRIAMEMMTRLARQAEKVSVSLDGNTLDLYFDIE
ncbi:MAG: prepilin-type N-terminal cleavage/methylation domain-containing protein, partial [Patescibacteria group bacterium]|nr:prepilin-type N-terminal cleavage/methylation domain-containing protein [Patescibacteria group bacterium]